MRWEEAPGSMAPPPRFCARLEKHGAFHTVEATLWTTARPSWIGAGQIVGMHVLLESVNEIV